MHKEFFRVSALLLLLGILLPTQTLASTYENTETGYEATIIDEADLLSSSEEEDLLEDMEAITEYGHVVFISLSDNPTYSAERYAMLFCDEYFKREDAVIFLIDMDTREIWLECNEDIAYTITNDYSQTITDNVYTYASDGNYYKCASKAFEQVSRLLAGKWIAQPMKYICNAFLAVAIALLINYFIVMMVSRSKKASANQLMNGIYTKVDINNARADFTHQTKRYSPQSSGSSGGGGGGGHSGGGGGGHHSGGGHKF